MLAERDILIQFFDRADRRGLVLPDDSQDLRKNLSILNSERGDQFVGIYEEWNSTTNALSLAALAQHYGLPTRLLDWTRKAYIGAYFAAESYAFPDPPCDPSASASESMVVWAFYYPLMGKQDFVSQPNNPVRIVTAPSATNPNLKAQQGVFTIMNPECTKERVQDYLPMEQVLAELERNPNHKVQGCKLQKFTLPTAEALSLLQMLAKLDLTPSTVYPGYRSVGEDIRMQAMFGKEGL